jgi:hypothetical protein
LGDADSVGDAQSVGEEAVGGSLAKGGIGTLKDTEEGVVVGGNHVHDSGLGTRLVGKEVVVQGNLVGGVGSQESPEVALDTGCGDLTTIRVTRVEGPDDGFFKAHNADDGSHTVIDVSVGGADEPGRKSADLLDSQGGPHNLSHNLIVGQIGQPRVTPSVIEDVVTQGAFGPEREWVANDTGAHYGE